MLDFAASVSWTGEMELFWTRLPIQSWAPSTTSGPLPAWLAVTKVDWISLATTCTATEMPCASPHLVAASLRELAFFSSAQMTRSASGSRTRASSEPAAEAESEPVESLEPPEQAAAAERLTATAVRDRKDLRLRDTTILLRIRVGDGSAVKTM